MRLRTNKYAFFMAVLLGVSAFLLPLISSSADILGASFSAKGPVMFNLIIEFLSGIFTDSIDTKQKFIIPFYIMVVLFLVSFILYILNGFGLIYNRYSRYASYLTIAYLFVGLYAINIINSQYGITTIFGSSEVSIGSGIYLVPMIGVIYLFYLQQRI